MEIDITSHARERMKKYAITEEALKSTLKKPDAVSKGQFGRKISQKALNGYTIRIIYEEKGGIITVITAYRAKRGRYEI